MVKESITSKDAAMKKQRKKFSSASEAGKSEEDTYKKLVDFEEAESSKRSPTKDSELYFQTCKSIRQLLSDISALKQQDTQEAREKIAEKRVEACMQVCVLKKLNRLEKFRTKAGRDALHQEKLRTDSTKLQLQNLLYELTYLKKEISKCFQFRSLDEEIDLVPEEDFFKHAPNYIARPNVTKTDKHQLQLARLEWELEQRKQLASQCKQLETEKETVATEIVSKQERLDKLAPQLHQILEAAKPLQEQLGITTNKAREEHQLAYLLPNPLYLLYTKADAYSQVYDNRISVSILGEEEEAKQLKKEDEVSLDSTADSDSDQDIDISEETVERQKRHHRQSSRISDTRESKQNKLLVSYPLYVRIEICLKDEKNFTLILDFYYKVKLHVITVKCQVITPDSYKGLSTGEILSKENMLRELFPDDTGKESPNPVNHYQLQQVGLTDFQWLMELPSSATYSAMGCPYLWAQRICGLDFIAASPASEPPTPSSQLSQTSVESIMKILTRRFKSRILLAKQMEDLENNIVSIVPEVYCVPSKLSSTVTSWRSITWLDYRALPSTESLVENDFVRPNDMFYKCTISRKTATLTAYIAIKNNFPEEKSIFILVLNGEYDSINCNTVRDMERAVNTDWPYENSRNFNTWLLSAQIRRTMACFDIYTEVTQPQQYEKEKIFFDNTRGRTRAHPYKYLKVGGGVFTQY